MRTGACFRMPLETEGAAIVEFNSLQAVIKQGTMGRPDILRQTVPIKCKAVILTCNQYLPGIKILHRVVGTVMAKLHLGGAGAGSQAQQLHTQAYTEYGYTGA